MKLFSALILCLITFPTSYGSTIYCSHLELCKMAGRIALENRLPDLKTENLVKISGDPHEYEPSTTEIKKLINAPLLLTGPSELNPWIKKIIFQRSKKTETKTISLLFEQKHLDLYRLARAETLSHFWLYPKIYCSLKAKLEEELKKLHYPTLSGKKCEAGFTEGELQKALNSMNYPIILTHDALLPLLQTLADTHTIVAIKGSGHHEETAAASIKKMYNALESPKAVWIVETGINVPQNILNKIRKNDLVIKIDTSTSKDENPFSVLDELTLKLKAGAEKKR